MANTFRKFMAVLVALTLCMGLIAIPAAATEIAPEAAPAPAAEPAAPAAEIPIPAAEEPVVEEIAAASAASVNAAAETGTEETDDTSSGPNITEDADRVPDPKVDHIDIGIDITSTILVNGEETEVKLTLEESDVENNISISNSTEEEDFRVDDLTAGRSTDKDGNSQIRVDGAFAVGSQSSPIDYTVEVVKNITVGEGEDAQTVTVTLSTTANYWNQDANVCPQLWNGGKGRPGQSGGSDTPNQNWVNGDVVNGSGIDIELTTATAENVDPETGTLVIQKIIEGVEEELTADQVYYFNVYETDTDDTTEDILVREQVAVTIKEGATSGYVIIQDLELGTYKVIEIENMAQMEGYELEEVAYAIAEEVAGNVVTLDETDTSKSVYVTNTYKKTSEQSETDPTDPPTDPTDPPTDPTDPPTDPTDPPTDPTNPPTDPTTPSGPSQTDPPVETNPPATTPVTPRSDAPRATAPKTGDLSLLWAAISGLSLGGMVLIGRKEDEE